MGIGFLKNVYNMQISLVPYSSMGHAMPLPTQILQESDSLLSNRKGSSQDCHRPDGAQGLLTRGFRLKPAGKSELTCILSTWSQVSQSQNLNISIGNYADKTRNGLRITNAPGTPGDLQLWTLFERADRYTCPEVFEGDILALGTLGVSLIFFSFSWVSPLPLQGHLWGRPSRKWWVSQIPQRQVPLATACGDSSPGSPSGNCEKTSSSWT